ncbi:MAG: DUF5682 family protein [Neisseria sp.]|nr:DUF5682 family protein [Neisseria sp.]
MTIRYFGIRHHGFGCSRHLMRALAQWQPDHILLEGPPEADSLLPLLHSPDMKAPVALLAYQPDQPQQAVYYPFAEFSPEWQTLHFARANNIPLQFFDLPLCHWLPAQQPPAEEEGGEDNAGHDNNDGHEDGEGGQEDNAELVRDPFNYLAELSGYEDGEAFWDAMFEQRQDDESLFEAIHTAVTALRESLPQATPERDLLREAWMRKMIRQAEKGGAEKIAVICGAWHVPALLAKIPAKDDNALLKGLPKGKIDCTWIPWTHSRLTYASGYGAGIAAPEWYAHCWQHPDDDGVLWISRTAHLLRKKNYDISAAYVIETVRLAQAAAALRGQHRPNLADYNEAVNTVMSMGDETLLNQIGYDLLIGNTLGRVPAETPMLPLIADVEKRRKTLRLPVTAEAKTITLDLRKPLDLQRSLFIHRMNLLDINWADWQHSGGSGTFKESWNLFYQPEHHIQLTEKAVFGNTLPDAVTNYVRRTLGEKTALAPLTELMLKVLPAELPELMHALTRRIADLSVNNSDLNDTLATLPHLAETIRYGNVRQTDTAPLRHLLHTLLTRLAAGGVQGCMNIDDDNAAALFDAVRAADYPLTALDDEELGQLWLAFIRSQQNNRHVHPLLAGNAIRLLFDKHQTNAEETALLMQQTLSDTSDYGRSAQWLEGFLHQSGTLLLIHDPLRHMVDTWVKQLGEEHFITLLPLLRRTFSSFEQAERRQLGEKLKHEAENGGSTGFSDGLQNTNGIDEVQGLAAAKTIALLF